MGVVEQLVQYCVLRKLPTSKVPQRWSTRLFILVLRIGVCSGNRIKKKVLWMTF